MESNRYGKFYETKTDTQTHNTIKMQKEREKNEKLRHKQQQQTRKKNKKKIYLGLVFGIWILGVCFPYLWLCSRTLTQRAHQFDIAL